MNKDGSRYRDWCAWRDERNTPAWIQREPWTGPRGLLVEGRPFLAHYDYKQTHLMYISGGWQMTRRQVMVDNPWNEELMWAGAEDCFLSKQLLQDVPQKYNYMMNTYSTVKLLKQKDVVLMERSDLR